MQNGYIQQLEVQLTTRIKLLQEREDQLLDQDKQLVKLKLV